MEIMGISLDKITVNYDMLNYIKIYLASISLSDISSFNFFFAEKNISF